MNKKFLIFLVALLLSMVFLFSTNLVLAAELDLRLNVLLNDTSTTFYAETDDNSLITYEGNDGILPGLPQDLPSALYSTIEGKNLMIDSWDKASTPRTINLTFTSGQNGKLNLTWNNPDSHFGVVLQECSSDYSSCFSVISGVLTQVNDVSTTKYLKLSVSYTPDSTSNPTSTPSGGAGGGATTEKPSMKIEIPHPITLESAGPVEFNITLENDGNKELTEVSLVGNIIINSKPKNTAVNFDKNNFKVFSVGTKETIKVSTYVESEEITVYEVVINASSKTPSYKTQAKVYLTFVGKNGSGVAKIVAFTEGLIDQNAECLELSPMILDARKLLDSGDWKSGLEKAQLALEACKKILETPRKPASALLRKDNIVLYLGIAIALAIVFGVIFNVYKLWRFGKFGRQKIFNHEKTDISKFQWK